jgi:hypothetical protein
MRSACSIIRYLIHKIGTKHFTQMQNLVFVHLCQMHKPVFANNQSWRVSASHVTKHMLTSWCCHYIIIDAAKKVEPIIIITNLLKFLVLLLLINIGGVNYWYHGLVRWRTCYTVSTR